MQASRTLRVAVVSPGDTIGERKAVFEAINRVDATSARFMGLHFAIAAWENVSPSSSQGTPQSILDDYLDFETLDLVIAIFKRKLGAAASGESGTVHEIKTARKFQLSTGRPRVSAYFWKPPDDERLAAEVSAFRTELQEWALWADYTSVEGLKLSIVLNLFDWTTQINARHAGRAEAPGEPRVTVAAPLSPTNLRVLGMTELLQPIALRLEGNESYAGQFIDLAISFNVNITSRIVDHILRSEATLLDAMKGVRITGKQVSTHSLVFERIEFRPGKYLTIDRIRLNAFQLGLPGKVSMFVQLLPSAGYQFPVGPTSTPTLVGEAKDPYVIRIGEWIQASQANVFTLACTVEELVEGAFTSSHAEYGGYCGTRILLYFFDVAGASVEPSHWGQLRPIPTDINGAAPVKHPQPNTFCFEWQDSGDTPHFRTAELEFILRIPAHEALPTISIVVEIGPLSVIGTASDNAIIPRFASVAYPIVIPYALEN